MDHPSTERTPQPPASPQPFVVSTDGLEPAARFDAWHAFFGDVNDIKVPRAERHAFEAASENRFLGGMVLTRNRTPRMGLARSPAASRRDGLDHRILRVCRTGRARTRAGGRSWIAGPGDLVVEPLEAGYEDVWERSAWISLNVSSADEPLLWRGLAALEPGPVAGAPAALLADYLLSLADRLPEAGPAELPALEEATRGMIAACLLQGRADPDTARPGLQVIQRRRAEKVVREHVASARLDPNRIADLAGLSRSALYRLFEPDGGVAAHVRRVRLEGVLSDLSDPSLAGMPISAVAERWGFFSVAAFNRTFRRAFGRTPGEVRAGALPAGTRRARRASGRDGRATTFGDLLR